MIRFAIVMLTLNVFAPSREVFADPLPEQPGNFVPPPSYSRWIYRMPTLHRVRVERRMPPLQSVHVDPPAPTPVRVIEYPGQPIAPGALFHPSGTPFHRAEAPTVVPLPASK
jgi:hypothetical protein